MSKYRDIAEGTEEGAKARPTSCETEHLEHLDALRETCSTNMFGARPWLMNAYPDLSEKDAAAILSYWMKSFGNETR